MILRLFLFVILIHVLGVGILLMRLYFPAVIDVSWGNNTVAIGGVYKHEVRTSFSSDNSDL